MAYQQQQQYGYNPNQYAQPQQPVYGAQPVYAQQQQQPMYGARPVYSQQPQQTYPPNQYYASSGPSTYNAPPTIIEAGEPKYNNLPPPQPPTINAKPKFHDVWATLLFLLVNLAFIGAAVVGVPEAVKGFTNSTETSNGKGTTSGTSTRGNSGSDFTLTGKEVGGVVGAAVGVGMVFSAVYFVAMMLFAGPLIHITYWLSFIVLLGLTAFYVLAKAYIAAVIWAIFAVLFAINYFLIRNRIPFAKVMLESCTRVYFTGHTVPGSKRIDVPDKAVTAKAVGRALTTSFGPICFGSLLVALIQTIRALVNQAKHQAAEDGNIFMCLLLSCISCILACFQDLFEYFNKYAYTEVAIYGKSYCDAAKDTWRLIQTRGLEAVINDNLIGNVLFIGSLLGGLTCAFVGFIFVKASSAIADTTANFAVVCVISALIGMWLFLILAEVITSGVATTYVCIAEDPATLARQQPELFAQLYRAWPDIQWGLHSTAY
ncbi:putative choline transporter, neither null mutation nor overexpression affects choline transport [Phlyctochytrium planicorne]|nr:putative choline transporter, neither null mutation nor overexpression affects choline transport [Phlyctochytrium planicorne]